MSIYYISRSVSKNPGSKGSCIKIFLIYNLILKNIVQIKIKLILNKYDPIESSQLILIWLIQCLLKSRTALEIKKKLVPRFLETLFLF